MEQTHIKTVVINIITGGVIIGLIVVGYYVVFKKNIPKLEEINTIAQIADETAMIGTEIDATVKDLRDLDRAVASSTIIFELPEFINLENFSAPIPAEEIGRKNPFIPTAWKLKIMTLIENTQKVSSSQPSSAQTSSPSTDEPEGI